MSVIVLEELIKDLAPRVLSFKDSIIMLGKLILDDDFVAGQNLILVDRISLKPLSKPSRGLGCKHVQCFDFDVYLMINKAKLPSEYSCPFCNQLCNPSKVYVDLVFVCLLELFPIESKFNLTDKGYLEIVTGASSAPKDVICIDMSSSDDDDGDEELFKTHKMVKKSVSSETVSKCSSSIMSIKDELRSGLQTTDHRLFLQDLSQMVQYLTSMGSKRQLSNDKFISIEDLTRVSLDDILHLMNKETAWGIESIPGLSTDMQMDLKNSRPFVSSTHQGLKHSLQLVRGVGTQKADNIIMHFSNILQNKLNAFQSFIIYKSAFTHIKAATTLAPDNSSLSTASSDKLSDYMHNKLGTDAPTGGYIQITATTAKSPEVPSRSSNRAVSDATSHSSSRAVPDEPHHRKVASEHLVAVDSGSDSCNVRLNSRKRSKKQQQRCIPHPPPPTAVDAVTGDDNNYPHNSTSQPSIAYDTTGLQFESTDGELTNRRKHRPASVSFGIVDVSSKPNFSKKCPSLLPPSSSEEVMHEVVDDSLSVSRRQMDNSSRGKTRPNRFNTEVGSIISSNASQPCAEEEISATAKRANRDGKAKKRRLPEDEPVQSDEVISHRPSKEVARSKARDKGTVAVAPSHPTNSEASISYQQKATTVAAMPIDSRCSYASTGATYRGSESPTYNRSRSHSSGSRSAYLHRDQTGGGDSFHSSNASYNTQNTYIVNNYHNINTEFGSGFNAPEVPSPMSDTQNRTNNKWKKRQQNDHRLDGGNNHFQPNNASNSDNNNNNNNDYNFNNNNTTTNNNINNSCSKAPSDIRPSGRSVSQGRQPTDTPVLVHNALTDRSISSHRGKHHPPPPQGQSRYGGGAHQLTCSSKQSSPAVANRSSSLSQGVEISRTSRSGNMSSGTHQSTFRPTLPATNSTIIPSTASGQHSSARAFNVSRTQSTGQQPNYGSISNKSNSFYRMQFRPNFDAKASSSSSITFPTMLPLNKGNGTLHIGGKSSSAEGSKASAEHFVRDFTADVVN